jgi:transmembrane sensor
MTIDMMLNDSSAPQSIDPVQQAAQWLTHLQSESVSAEDRKAFESWKSASPEHAQIYEKLASLWSGMDAVDAKAGKVALNTMFASHKRKSALRKANGLLGLALLIGTAWLGMKAEYAQYYLADHRSKTGEQLHVALSDNSAVILDTQSAMNVDFNPDLRNIALVKGALFIDVAKDVNRPLIVNTEFGTAQAMGTQFVVEKNADAMTVVVKESHVKVCAKDIQTLCITLTPGEAVDVGRKHISSIRQVDPVAAFAWTKGNLIADNLPLTTLLERLGRYKNGHLSYDAQALEGIRVSGVFKLTDVDQTLQHLSETVAVRVETNMPYWTIVQPK